MPVSCGGGTFLGCAIETLPWVIAGLVALVVVLVVARVALSLRERWARPRTETPAPVRAPRDVRPGESLQPAKADQQQTTRAPQPPRQPSKPSPLQLQIADRPDLKVTDFANSSSQGDFGELLTSIVLAQDGWIKLKSKHGTRGQGIDGLFVREVRGGGGYEALAVETKTNGSRYDPASMTDEKLARDIGDLYAAGAFGRGSDTLSAELIRGLDAGPPFFRKELWRHNLSTGLTGISQLGANGEVKSGTWRSYARVATALNLSLKQLDRSASYIGRKPVDEP